MRVIPIVSILFALTTVPVYADCTPPDDAVQIPNGATATRDQMIAAQKAVKAYNTAVNAYGDCLTQDEDAKVAAGGDKAKLTPAYDKLNNVQVVKLKAVAAKFNDELHAYKAKNPG